MKLACCKSPLRGRSSIGMTLTFGPLVRPRQHEELASTKSAKIKQPTFFTISNSGTLRRFLMTDLHSTADLMSLLDLHLNEVEEQSLWHWFFRRCAY